MEFRKLRADEIDCRAQQVSAKGLALLLYKDARCDMNILDETVGCMKWQRSHSRDNANCTVSIWSDDLKMWVSKEDTGTESNTEAEKGLASDSFKRACFNWGIGRELYTAPFIWIAAKDCNIENKNGRMVCYDRFDVASIAYDGNVISELAIRNTKTGKIAFEWYKNAKPRKSNAAPKAPAAEPIPKDIDIPAMRNRLNKITFALAQGKPENVATAVSIWTKDMFVRIEDIPDDMVAAVLNIAEKAYRKRGYTD